MVKSMYTIACILRLEQIASIKNLCTEQSKIELHIMDV